MNKLLRLKKVIAALLVAGVVVPAMFHSASVSAQTADEAEKQKINLMVAALNAKDAGDLSTAKAKLEQLLALDPNADGAKDLLDQVSREINARSPQAATSAVRAPAAPAAAPIAAAPVVAAEPATPLDVAAQKYESLYSEVQTAMTEAQQEAYNGNSARALQLIDSASAALPDNTGSQELKGRLSLLRQQIIAARDSGSNLVGVEQEASRVIADKVAEMRRASVEANRLTEEARSQIKRDQLDAAQATLDKATNILPNTIATAQTYGEIRKVQSILLATRMHRAVDARDIPTAERYLTEFGNLNGVQSKEYLQLKAELDEKKADPRYVSINSANPNFPALEVKVKDLIHKGQALYLYGDYEGAIAAFKEVLQYQANNTTAKAYTVRIRDILSRSGAWNRTMVKQDMLSMVDEGWIFPSVYTQDRVTPTDTGEDVVMTTLKKTIVPTITLRDAPLSRAIETLAELSVAYDPEGKGVNMVTLDPDHKNPPVSISMRNVSLDRVLEFVTKTAGFNYSINQGIIEVRPGTGTGETETEFFPVTAAAILKITGISPGGSSDAGSATTSVWGTGGGSAVSSGDARPEEAAVKSFLQRSGIGFDTVPNSALSYDGTRLIVTQSRQNLEKIKNILRRYSDIKQVHIESKFIEVTEGALRQLSANWIVSKPGADGTTRIRARTGLRTLDGAFGSSGVSLPGRIITTPTAGDVSGGVIGTTSEFEIPNTAPGFPQGNTGPTEMTFDGIIGSIGSWDLRLMVSAIQENEGSDLMAAPSLTVLDGKTATIRIAQLLRYPESYGEIQSNVGTSGGGYGTSGSGASVTITAGTPQDFTVQEVGVKLEVTPTVAEDDSITLNLKPQVTEFEGFVEYGGTSVAIAGNTTVTVPSGFFQPIFSVREVTTDVVVFDGATVVIGGLTREETKTVNDKVPVLGDLPLFGPLFQSNGKSTTKKNLMVFVTANLVSPGGSLLRSSLGTIPAGSTFSNPTLVTPGGSVPRVPVEAKSPQSSN